jgi:hypothetical protein
VPPPPTTTGDGFSIALNKDGPDFFFTRSVSGGDVKQFLHGLRMVAAEFVHYRPATCVGPECRDDISIADLQEFMALPGEFLKVHLGSRVGFGGLMINN